MRQPSRSKTFKPPLLVGPQYEAPIGVGGVDPNRRIVGRVALARHGFGLDNGLRCCSEFVLVGRRRANRYPDAET